MNLVISNAITIVLVKMRSAYLWNNKKIRDKTCAACVILHMYLGFA